jgi:hypothetical protein
MSKPYEYTYKNKKYYNCKYCTGYLSSKNFYQSFVKNKRRCCIVCYKERRKYLNIKQNKYYNIKRYLDREGKKNNDNGCNTIDKSDIKYIMEVIYKNKSIVDGSNIFINLILVKWYKNELISPWNLVCMTKPQAKKHVLLNDNDIYDNYSENVINSIENKLKSIKSYYVALLK